MNVWKLSLEIYLILLSVRLSIYLRLISYCFQDFQTWIFEITVERSSHRILSKNWPNISILASIWTLDPAQTRSKSNILKSFAFQENRYKKET